jgi:hypothetical protein
MSDLRISELRTRIAAVPFDRRLLEARLTLGLITSDQMPEIAFEALKTGFDGAAIRQLSALENPTDSEVFDLCPRVYAEMQLQDISDAVAALRVAAHIAKEALDQKDYFKPLHELYWLWMKAGFSKELEEAGTLYDDVAAAQLKAEPDGKIREWVRERLEEVVQRAAAAEQK